ncbi:unnamed protein product [Meloidogyne enterolobii]|uniref:Uncharacterized protein n=1 Tax=Meloidogyne enterolobii TaxID=390850 RepID=A0ACB1A5M0_MELEN
MKKLKQHCTNFNVKIRKLILKIFIFLMLNNPQVPINLESYKVEYDLNKQSYDLLF